MSLALFDLDNTLIAGDSDHGWGEFLVRRQLVDADHFSRSNDQFYRDYQNGCLDIGAYLKFALAPLTRFDRETLDQLHREFMAEVIEPIWLPKAEALLQQHREAGDFLLVITSTNRFVVEPICNRLGVDHLIASEPEIIAGRYTGNFIDVPSYREGKVTRLNAWLTETGRDSDMAGASFYSDSINDLPLLEVVDRPVAVDPCPALRQTAEQRGWEIISLR